MASERSRKVVFGSRWRGSLSGKAFVVTAVHDDGRVATRYEDGTTTERASARFWARAVHKEPEGGR